MQKTFLASVLSFALVAAGCTPTVVARGPDIAPAVLDVSREPESFTTRDGLKLGVSTWRAANPRAVIVAFHGMNDYAGFIREPAAYWQGEGISTYALDQRGFGRSPNRGLWAGDDAMTGDARDFIARVRAENPGKPLYLLGESMGGAVVMATLARPDAPHADGVILVAPAVWGWSTMNFWYRSALWVVAHTLPWKRVTGSGLSIQPSDNIEALRDLGRDPLVIKPTRTDAVYGLVGLMDEAILNASRVKAPVLLLYGQNDQIVPRWPIQKLVEAMNPAPRIVLYPRGYHLLMRDLGRQLVWDDVLAFLDGAGGKAPSGYEFARQDFIKGKVWKMPPVRVAKAP
ncbi:MAG: lysophospholipase [Alphaproteobacteria bacterium]|nr:lysophospholipase [Alphaproteobacteria bacterium]